MGIREVVILLIFKSLQIEGTTSLVEAANSKHVLYQSTCEELGLEETNIKLSFLAVSPSTPADFTGPSIFVFHGNTSTYFLFSFSIATSFRMSPILPFLLALSLSFAPKTIGLTLGSNSKLCAVTAASTITNSGFTVLTGCLCLSPGSAYTGFPPGTSSCFEVGSSVAIGSEAEAATTFGNCAALNFTQDLSGVPLAGLTLGPGVYRFATTAALAGNVTLDAAGDPNSQFIFQIGTALLTGVSSRVLLINDAKACNVYWCVGSSATIAARNEFNGVVIAYSGITVGTSTTEVGGFYALNAAVTLLTNAIVKSGEC